MLDSKFSSQVVTLADVLTRLEMATDLSANRRRDLRSAVTTFCRLAGHSPSDMLVNVPALRGTLLGLHPVRCRMSKKRLSNIGSDFRTALSEVGCLPEDVVGGPITVAWGKFLGSAKKSHQSPFLSRLARYCSQRGLNPNDVDDALLADFHVYLNTRVLSADPTSICRQTRYKFNAIVRDNGLPIAQLTTRGDARHNLPLVKYPPSFRADLEQLIIKRGSPNLYDEDAAARPHSAITLRNITARVRQVLDAAVGGGCRLRTFRRWLIW